MRYISKYLLLALGTALLSACGAFRIQVPLPDQTLDLSTAAPTATQVVYLKSPLAFPAVSLTSVFITGQATYTATTGGALTITFYARATEPTSCTLVATTYYLCDATGEKEIGSISFSAPGETRSVTFQGDAAAQTELISGIGNGRLWLGAKYGGTLGTGVKIDFKQMVASVTVL